VTDRFRLFPAALIGGASLILSLGAGLPASHAATEAAEGIDSLLRSPFGHYLAGRYAQQRFDYHDAAKLYALPLETDPNDPALLTAAYLALIGDGQIVEAAALAQRLVSIAPDDRLADMVLAIETIKDGQWARAAARLDTMPTNGLNALVGPLLKGWVAVGLGKPDQAQDAAAPLAHTKGMSAIVELQLGLMNDVAGRADVAETHYRQALANVAQGSLRLIELVGNFYQRQNKTAEAKALYDKVATEQSSGLWLDQMRRALATGPKVAPVIATPQQGAAEVLFEIATILVQQEATEPGLRFGRLALDLQPDFTLARMLVAGVVSAQNHGEEAIALYREVPPDTAFGWQARLDIALELDKLDRTEEAVALLQTLIKERPEQIEARLQLGNVQRGHERYAEAAAAYSDVLQVVGEAQPEHWSIFYFRGICYERGKQWPKAEADLRKALELSPDQPLVLNYLAYSWIEMGQHFDEALDMLRRAVAARPSDGYIIDSLGWAFYRLGRYDEAVTNLEHAVEFKPVDPTINDHLGDAYWRAGRHVEARYQWRRALQFKPAAEQVPTIEAKIEKGLTESSGG
jgi:tetratricopeptide (TPR) repeat protein